MKPYHNEEARRKIGEAARRHWEVPSIRERIIRGLKRSQNRPEVRAKIAAGMRKVWAERRAAAEAVSK